MPKGRTNSPLTIWVFDDWYENPAMRERAAQGHNVYRMSDVTRGDVYNAAAPDLIIHPAAQNWTEEMFLEEEKKDGTKYRPYLDTAFTAARAMKKTGKRSSAA